MRGTVLRYAVLYLVLSVVLVALGQQAPSISVTGSVKPPLTLTAADLAAMPRAKAATDNNGIQTMYEGVWLSDVLKKSRRPFGARPPWRGVSGLHSGFCFGWLSGGVLNRGIRSGHDCRTVPAGGYRKWKTTLWRERSISSGYSHRQTGCAICSTAYKD